MDSAPPPYERRLRERARELIARNLALAGAPLSFGAGLEWINTREPLEFPRDGRGRVLLLNFWNYGRVHCLQAERDLGYLQQKFDAAPFGRIGLHAASFENQANPARVREAVERLGLEHPIALEPRDETCRRLGVHAWPNWPSYCLLGADGRLLARVQGEGQRALLEALIAEALAALAPKAAASAPAPALLPVSALRADRPLRFPENLALHARRGELWISDTGHHRLVVTTLDGRFLRCIGSGAAGLVDGAAADARFDGPRGLCFYGDTLLVADTGNHALRQVELQSGTVSTLCGDGQPSELCHTYGGAWQTRLNSPWDVLVLGDEAYLAMAGMHQIWRLDLESLQIEDWAGNGDELRCDGARHRAGFAQPQGLAERDGLLWVADAESSSVREIEIAEGLVATLAGGAADPRDLLHFGREDGAGLGRRFQHPSALLALDRELIVSDSYNHRLVRLDRATGHARTLAGSAQGLAGHADGPSAQALFCEPGGLASHAGLVYLADTNNHAVRVLDLERDSVSSLPLSGIPAPPILPNFA